MATAGATLDVLLEDLDQLALAGAAQQEVGTAAQVLLELATRRAGGRQQRAMAHAAPPQQQSEQQQAGSQSQREMVKQQYAKGVPLAAMQQGDLGVLGQVPEQPGVVMLADLLVLPDPGIGQHRDEALAVREQQQMGRLATVRPSVGAVLGIVQVIVGIEADVGRFVLVLQIQAGELVLGRGLLARRFRRAGGVPAIATQALGEPFAGLDLLQILGQVLADAELVEQQVAALALGFVPDFLG